MVFSKHGYNAGRWGTATEWILSNRSSEILAGGAAKMGALSFGDGWGPVEKLSSLSRVQGNLDKERKHFATCVTFWDNSRLRYLGVPNEVH